jgi:predicted DNA-binding WGR domain protein
MGKRKIGTGRAKVAIRGFVTHGKADHSGKTKFYETTAIAFGDRSVLINRWGAIGATGQTGIEKFNTLDGAMKALNEKVREKEQRGYGPFRLQKQNVSSMDMLRELFRGRFDASKREEALEYLSKGIDPGAAIVTSDEPKAEVIDRTGDQTWGTW